MLHFFFPFALLLLAAGALLAVDITLDALDGAAEVDLLPAADFTLSSALFCFMLESCSEKTKVEKSEHTLTPF